MRIQNSRLVSAFQDKLVDQSDKFYKRVVDNIVKTYGEINFENFVRMIFKNSKIRCRRLNKCGLDKHWKPFISRCGYCDIPYKVIRHNNSTINHDNNEIFYTFSISLTFRDQKNRNKDDYTTINNS